VILFSENTRARTHEQTIICFEFYCLGLDYDKSLDEGDASAANIELKNKKKPVAKPKVKKKVKKKKKVMNKQF
jgi:hypothetical protein